MSKHKQISFCDLYENTHIKEEQTANAYNYINIEEFIPLAINWVTTNPPVAPLIPWHPCCLPNRPEFLSIPTVVFFGYFP